MQLGLLPRQIDSQLQQSRRVLLAGHTDPDADCLGALTAFASYLEGAGRTVDVYSATPAAGGLRFLPGATRVRQTYAGPYDAVVVLDCGDLRHTQLSSAMLAQWGNPLLVNIDHHHTNTRFGTVNLVQPEAASTTEILHHYFVQLDVRRTPDMATSLLAGILGDTGGFQYGNTTPEVLAAAADLVAAGATLSALADLTFKDKTLVSLQCWGHVLARLRVNPALGVATAVISRVDVPRLSGQSESMSGLANFLNSLSGVRAVVVLTEQDDGTVRCSLRSKDPLLDVSTFATLCGGGGHKLAAGFTIKGKLEETTNGWRIVENYPEKFLISN